MCVLDFRIDTTSGQPPYAQLVAQVKQALRLGWLQPGDKLPTAHQVASSVAINPNTVQKAYKELEYEGLVVGKARAGHVRPAQPEPVHALVAGRAEAAAGALAGRCARRRPGRGRNHGRYRGNHAGF